MSTVLDTPARTAAWCAVHYDKRTECQPCHPNVRRVCCSGPTHRLTVESLNAHILALDAAIGVAQGEA